MKQKTKKKPNNVTQLEEFRGAIHDGRPVLGLIEDSSGNVKNTSKYNYNKILEEDPKLRGKIKYNAFLHQIEVAEDVFWRKEWNNNANISPVIQDGDEYEIMNYLSDMYGLDSTGNTREAVSRTATRNQYDPVIEMLEGFEWDGEERVETVFIKHLGVEDTPLNREMAKVWLKGLVARILEPGIKFDYTIILHGEQGAGKSQMLSRLAFDKYFTDSISSIDNKDALLQLQGNCIVELAEGVASKKADIDRVKQFLTIEEDEFRQPYGKHTGRYPRRCVFAITDNENKVLKDPTGNRRFLPMKVDITDVPKEDRVYNIPDEYIEQVWAEAKVLYEEDNNLFIKPEFEDDLRRLREDNTDFVIDMARLEELIQRPIPLPPSVWRKVDGKSRLNYYKYGTIDEDLEDIVGAHDDKLYYTYKYLCITDITIMVTGKDKEALKSSNFKMYNLLMNQIEQCKVIQMNKIKSGPGYQKKFGHLGRFTNYYTVVDNPYEGLPGIFTYVHEDFEGALGLFNILRYDPSDLKCLAILGSEKHPELIDMYNYIAKEHPEYDYREHRYKRGLRGSLRQIEEADYEKYKNAAKPKDRYKMDTTSGEDEAVAKRALRIIKETEKNN